MQNHFPIWKNLLILIVLIFGIVYSLPNLYGDDPSVQISAGDATDITELQLAHIEGVSIQPTPAMYSPKKSFPKCFLRLKIYFFSFELYKSL
jgi:hypothetical protein